MTIGNYINKCHYSKLKIEVMTLNEHQLIEAKFKSRFILEYAVTCKGIVVSQDQFRDLYVEKAEYKDTIENRLLVPTFVGDYVMFPEDPLGRNGPSLAEFLKH